MELANLWLLIGAVVAVLVAAGIGLVIGLRGRRMDAVQGAAPIARAERLRALTSFRHAVHRRMLALAGILALTAVTAIVAGVVAARPMSSQTILPVNTSRDIMLCLDVSGSMSEVDVEVLSVFEELIDDFQGERIGLTIFNSSPVQIFPLTDDYDFIREHLASIRESFDYAEDVPEHWVGTLNGPGASLIGDGLASCALGFDHEGDERSRSIILATDNEVNGSSIVTLEEAAAFAASRQTRVFALNPVEGKDTGPSEALIRAAEATGGAAFGLRATTTVGDIVTQVQEQEATELQGQAQVVWSDDPNLWIVLLVIPVLGLIVVLWRVRL